MQQWLVSIPKTRWETCDQEFLPVSNGPFQEIVTSRRNYLYCGIRKEICTWGFAYDDFHSKNFMLKIIYLI